MATLVRQRFDSYVDSLRPTTTTTVPATTVPTVPSRPPAAAVAPRAERDDAFGVDSAWAIGAIAGSVLVGGMLVALDDRRRAAPIAVVGRPAEGTSNRFWAQRRTAIAESS